jgi:opacity protein-like surface antigen
MEDTMKKTLSAIALAATLPLAATTTASAKDVSGKFGVGGQLDSGIADGLNFRYWINDFGLQGTLAMMFMDGEPESQFQLGLSVRALYNFARANDTNLYVGAGLSLGLIDADQTFVDLILGVEHFFTDHFSVGGQVGAHFDVGSDNFGFSLGNNASWGTAFHFYF